MINAQCKQAFVSNDSYPYVQKAQKNAEKKDGEGVFSSNRWLFPQASGTQLCEQGCKQPTQSRATG